MRVFRTWALVIVAAVLATLGGTLAMAQNGGGVVRGRVVDDGGRPVAGATITATYQSMQGGSLLYGGKYNRKATTGADGRYSISLKGMPLGEYATSGSYNGIDLLPDTKARFAGNAQTVRNFRAAIVESTDDNDYGNGGIFVAENDFGDYTELEGLQVTLTSLKTGQTYVKSVRRTGEGWTVTGLPYGGYRATARFNGRPVQLKLWGPGDHDFAASVEGVVGNLKIMRVYVKR